MYEYEIRGQWYVHPLTLLFSPQLGQLLLCFEWHRTPLNRKVSTLLYALTALICLAGILLTRLDYALQPLVILGLTILMVKRRVPWRQVTLVLLLLIILNPVKLAYRSMIGYRTWEFSQYSIAEMTQSFLESIKLIWTQEDYTMLKIIGVTSSRLNYLGINAIILSEVPDIIPYELGKSWLFPIYSFIPRFLWPEKPNITEITNDRFAVLFGFTTWELTERTTSAYPNISDGYWNFGWFGVLIVGFFSGLFWRLICQIWSPKDRFRYLFAFYVLVDTKATVSLAGLLSGLPQIIVACYLIVKVFELASRPLSTKTVTVRRIR